MLSHSSDDFLNLVCVHCNSLGSDDDANVFDLYWSEFGNLCTYLWVLVQFLSLSEVLEEVGEYLWTGFDSTSVLASSPLSVL